MPIAPQGSPLPLTGIRVLDVSQVMAGPYCCMMLGDMGADIVKVEPRGVGDSTRNSMAYRLKGTDSPGFYAMNRNKRSIALDLKDPEDRKVFYALVKTADAVVENARPGVADRLGMGYETLREINPRLVYASISGFGQEGPWSQRPGFDLIAQAMSGVLAATGLPGMEPVKNVIPMADLGASLFAAFGILAALLGRASTGTGQFIDVALLDAAMGLSIWETAEFWATGRPPQPIGSANRMSAPYQVMRASDGYFVIGAANQKLWLNMLQAIARPELNADPRFASNVLRLEHRAALIDQLNRIFASRTVDEWVGVLLAAGVPAGPIYDYEQALASEQAVAREMVMQIEHPVEGSYPSLGFPLKMRGTPQQVRYPPPLLDQHGDELRRELVEKGLLEHPPSSEETRQ